MNRDRINQLELRDFRIDTYRMGWKDCPHVRVTYIPNGMTEECDSEPSQHRNQAIAMERLCARIRAIKGDAS